MNSFGTVLKVPSANQLLHFDSISKFLKVEKTRILARCRTDETGHPFSSAETAPGSCVNSFGTVLKVPSVNQLLHFDSISKFLKVEK